MPIGANISSLWSCNHGKHSYEREGLFPRRAESAGPGVFSCRLTDQQVNKSTPNEQRRRQRNKENDGEHTRHVHTSSDRHCLIAFHILPSPQLNRKFNQIGALSPHSQASAVDPNGKMRGVHDSVCNHHYPGGMAPLAEPMEMRWVPGRFRLFCPLMVRAWWP